MLLKCEVESEEYEFLSHICTGPLWSQNRAMIIASLKNLFELKKKKVETEYQIFYLQATKHIQ